MSSFTMMQKPSQGSEDPKRHETGHFMHCLVGMWQVKEGEVTAVSGRNLVRPVCLETSQSFFVFGHKDAPFLWV